MIVSSFSRTVRRVAFTAGSLTLLGLAGGCGSVDTVPSGGGGGSGGQMACAQMPPSAGGGTVTPWSAGYDISIEGIAADREGNVLLAAGYVGGALKSSLGPLPPTETGAGLVAKLSPAGARLWIKVWDGVSAVAVDDCGNTFVALVETTTPTTGPKDTFKLAKLDRDGHEIWERTFHPEPHFIAGSLLVDAHGDLVMYGSVVGVLELVDDGSPHVGVTTAFFAGFSGATGEPRWTEPIDGETGVGMGLDVSGDVVVVGDFGRIGAATIAASPTTDGSIALVRLDASGGVKSIARTGPSHDFRAGNFVVTPQGDVGAYGRCPVMNTGDQWCMARFAAGGAAAVTHTVGTKTISNDDPRVVFDATGNLLMLSQAFDMNDPVTPYSDHLYLTRMSPAGAITRAEDWRSGGTVVPAGLDVDPAGGILLAATTGLLSGAAINVGNGPKSPTIVARLAP